MGDTVALASLPWERKYLAIYRVHEHSKDLSNEFMDLKVAFHGLKEGQTVHNEFAIQEILVEVVRSNRINACLIRKDTDCFDLSY
jgi:hypothetical protein